MQMLKNAELEANVKWAESNHQTHKATTGGKSSL
jgi:hypothetical protein